MVLGSLNSFNLIIVSYSPRVLYLQINIFVLLNFPKLVAYVNFYSLNYFFSKRIEYLSKLDLVNSSSSQYLSEMFLIFILLLFHC